MLSLAGCVSSNARVRFRSLCQIKPNALSQLASDQVLIRIVDYPEYRAEFSVGQAGCPPVGLGVSLRPRPQ